MSSAQHDPPSQIHIHWDDNSAPHSSSTPAAANNNNNNTNNSQQSARPSSSTNNNNNNVFDDAVPLVYKELPPPSSSKCSDCCSCCPSSSLIVDTQHYRFISLIVFAFTLMGIDRRQQQWWYYILFGIVGDYVARLFYGNRASLFGTVAEILLFFLRKLLPFKGHYGVCASYSYSAPYRVSDLLNGLWLSVALILWWQDGTFNTESGATFMVSLVLLTSFIEFVLHFNVYAYLTNYLISKNALSSVGRVRAINMLHDREVHDALRVDEAAAPHSAKRVYRGTESHTARTFIGTWTQKSEHVRRTTHNLLKYIDLVSFWFPVSILSLSNVYLVCSFEHVFNWNTLPTDILAVTGGSIWTIFLILYLLKLVLFPKRVWREWQHSTYKHFSVLPFMGFVLLAPLIQGGQYARFAETFLWLGAAPILVLSVCIFVSVLRAPVSEDAISPVWFTSLIASLLASYAIAYILGPTYADNVVSFRPLSPTPSQLLTAMELVYKIHWIWLAFPIFMWVILSTFVYRRLLFKPALFDSSRPYVSFVLAVPSLINVSYAFWNTLFAASPQNATVGIRFPDGFYEFTFWVGIIQFLILTLLVLIGYFGHSGFSFIWWSYSFPLNVTALSCVYYHVLHHTTASSGIVSTALVIVSAFNTVLFANTILAILEGREFKSRRDGKESAIDVISLQNKAITNSCNELLRYAADMNNEDSYRALRILFYNFQLTLKTSIELNIRVLFPALNDWFPQCTFTIAQRSTQLDLATTQMMNNFRNLSRYALGSDEFVSGAATISSDMTIYTSTIKQLMSDIELELLPIARKYMTPAQHRDIVSRIVNIVPTPVLSRLLPFVFTFLYSDCARVHYLACINAAATDKLPLYGKVLYEHGDDFLLNRLVARIPALAPRGTRGFVKSF